jgi:hypothetical protein
MYFESSAEGFSLFAAVGQRVPPGVIPIIGPPPLLLALLALVIAVGVLASYLYLTLTKQRRMLKKLERAVLRPKPRRVEELLVGPPEEAPKEVRKAEITMLRRLKRTVLGKKGSR